MPPLILTSTPEAAATGNDVRVAPRQDFLMLADAVKGTVLYPPATGNDTLFARIEKRLAADVRQAVAALKHRKTTSVYVSLSEKVGVPLAFLLPKNRANRPAHVLIAHNVTSANKVFLQKRTAYLSRFDAIIALGTSQAAYLTSDAGYSAANLTRVRHAVDATFWTPQTAPATPAPYLLAVGRERRDYPMLADALRLLPEMSCVVVASSPWSRQAGQSALAKDDAPPANMTFRRGLSYPELRELYAGAAVVIVPLVAGTRYAAGATGLLEAMAMARPVVATATPGLTDYQVNDNGKPLACLVEPSAPALAAGIRALVGDAPRREALAHTGRRFVEAFANVDEYVAAIAAVISVIAKT